MHAIQSWALSVCVSMVGAAVFSLLIPNSNLKKVISFTVSLFFLSSLLAPFAMQFREIDISEMTGLVSNEQTALTKQAEEQVIEQTEESIKKQLYYIFEKNGYKVEDISINIDRTTLEQRSFDIVIFVQKSQASQEKEIMEAVRMYTGVTPQMIYV